MAKGPIFTQVQCAQFDDFFSTLNSIYEREEAECAPALPHAPPPSVMPFGRWCLLAALPSLVLLLLPGAAASSLCFDSCWSNYVANGICNDGGPGTEFTACPLGTDCTDCGPRDTGDPPTPPAAPPIPPMYPGACECASPATGCLADGVDVSSRCGCSEHLLSHSTRWGVFCYVGKPRPSLPTALHPP